MTANEWVVVGPGTDAERAVPVQGRLLVGRECAGVDPGRCLIVDDAAVSRDHFEIRIDPGRGAILVDLSTNGTRVNGRRVERAEPIALHDLDVIELGTAGSARSRGSRASASSATGRYPATGPAPGAKQPKTARNDCSGVSRSRASSRTPCAAPERQIASSRSSAGRSRTTIRRPGVATQPAVRSAPRARAPAPRDPPAQLASSARDSGGSTTIVPSPCATRSDRPARARVPPSGR